MTSPPAETRTFRFEALLVGDRWVRDAQLEVDAAGRIRSLSRCDPDATSPQVRGWTIPGVPNLHSHAFQRALAGLAEASGPDSFWSWREAMFRFVALPDPDDVEAIALQLYVELLKAGFTSVGEFHYLHHPPGGGRYENPAEMSCRIVRAARSAGIGLVHMPVVYETGGLGGEPLTRSQRRFLLDLDEAMRIREALATASRDAGCGLGLALHSVRAVRPETFRRILEDPGAAGSPMHIHVAEQEREVSECLSQRRARPVEWLLDHAPVDQGWCLVHATHLTETESAAVAASGAVVGLCPTTEANLGDGIFPLGPFARSGGRYGIGTDSHVSRSPVEELRLLEYGQRLALRTRSVQRSGARGGERAGAGGELAGAGAALADPGGALAGAGGALAGAGGALAGAGQTMADAGGALAGAGGALAGAGGALLAHAWEDGCRALAWDAGTVAVGMRADLVVLDAEHPALAGRTGHAVLDSWVFSGTESPVRDVMVGGRWVVRQGRHELEQEAARGYAAVARELAAGG